MDDTSVWILNLVYDLRKVNSFLAASTGELTYTLFPGSFQHVYKDSIVFSEPI